MDQTNTLGGKYGFVVEYANGALVTELDRFWDEIEEPIVAVSIYDFRKSLRLLELRGYQKFFFANESVSSKLAGAPVLSAKLLGGVNGGQAVECRVDLLETEPKGSRRDLPAAELPYTAKSFRAGVE